MYTQQGSSRALRLGLCAVVLSAIASVAQADVKVWVNPDSSVYHCPGSPYYGANKHGKTLDEGAAARAGYHAAFDRACSPPVAPALPPSAPQNFDPNALRHAMRRSTR